MGEGDWDEGDETIDGVDVMPVVVGAFLGVFPLDVVREEHPVASACVHIVVTVWGGHERDVTRQIIVFIKTTAVFVHASEEESFKGCFQGAFPCFQTVVIMELTAF